MNSPEDRPTPPGGSATESGLSAGLRWRSATAGDTAALAALWAACGLTRAWNDPAKDIQFARAGAASDVLVAVDGDVIVSSVMVGHDGHRGAVYYLAVAPAWQGRGLGRAAMAEAEAWLKARGVWKLNLMVRNENAKAIGFYERLGYCDSAVTVMQKTLE
jgi:ribosomal protein S18 acetylase RimI-like enzyme